MNKNFISGLILAVMVGCQAPQTSSEAPIPSNEPMDTVTNGGEERKVSEIKPKLEQMLSAAHSALDAKEQEKQDSLGQKEVLVLRSDGENWPVVMEVDRPEGKFVYYFQNQQLLAVDNPRGHFIIEDNKMKVWADQNWKPLTHKSTEEWIDQENQILLEAKNYLATFDINYEY
ncbi:hypothetical protein [Litoribacter populi]|uniref:hypothetical protein n=1 Tax=Litoribacter populi TaxID=2598460 RepID=UPI00117C10B8|nr:hypothetical protein [Litoribacter populi]